MTPLLLATRNPHKLRELGRLLAPYEVRALADGVALPAETGSTYAENALAKARAAAAATGRPALADDSGIEAAALGGAPGVRSARFAGEDAGDEQNLDLLLERAPAGSALAYVCVIAWAEPAGGPEHVRGPLRGNARHPPARAPRIRLRPGVRARGVRRRTHDGGATRRREGRDQPPRPRGAGVPRMAPRTLTA